MLRFFQNCVCLRQHSRKRDKRMKRIIVFMIFIAKLLIQFSLSEHEIIFDTGVVNLTRL